MGYRDWSIFKLHMRGFDNTEIADRLRPTTEREILTALSPSAVGRIVTKTKNTVFKKLGGELLGQLTRRGQGFSLSDVIDDVQQKATAAQSTYLKVHEGGQRALSEAELREVRWLYARVDKEGVAERGKAHRESGRAKPRDHKKDEKRRKKRLAENPNAAAARKASRKKASDTYVKKNRAAHNERNRIAAANRLAKLKKDPAAYEAYLKRRRDQRAARKKKKGK